MVIERTEEAQRQLPEGKLTFEEFLEWGDDTTWSEWVDGAVIVASPASRPHQDIGSFLETMLRVYVEAHRLGIVLRAPFVMRLREVSRAREPDILLVAKERLHLLGHTHLDGPADLTIEITSAESIGRDRGEKFVEYEQAGVPEYWLIDPERRQAEFYQLGPDGRYRLAELELGGVYRSRVVPGFWLRVDWLWQEPLPAVLEVLRELGVV
jgi:Uma2 family endonuclease